MRAPSAIEPNTTIAPRADVRSRVLDGEAVLLHLGSGRYSTLNGAGTFLWALLTEGPAERTRLDALHRRLVEHYAVDEGTAWTDLVALVQQLLDEDLVEIRSER